MSITCGNASRTRAFEGDAVDGSAVLSLYDMPELYDAIVRRGPCEGFYRHEAKRGGSVLELACGTGRLTLPIALDGHEVVGLDASPAMLAAASRKAVQRGMAARFVLGDMRDFDLGRHFGLVIVSCNSLAHLTRTEDLRRCFAAVRQHLAPGGVFAFDVVQPNLRLLTRPEKKARRLDIGPNPSSAIEAEEVTRYDPIAQVRFSQWRIRLQHGGGQTMVPLALRQFFPQELPLLLEAGGLKLVARYGDFARNPLGPESLNQVCLAQASDEMTPDNNPSSTIPSCTVGIHPISADRCWSHPILSAPCAAHQSRRPWWKPQGRVDFL